MQRTTASFHFFKKLSTSSCQRIACNVTTSSNIAGICPNMMITWWLPATASHPCPWSDRGWPGTTWSGAPWWAIFGNARQITRNIKKPIQLILGLVKSKQFPDISNFFNFQSIWEMERWRFFGRSCHGMALGPLGPLGLGQGRAQAALCKLAQRLLGWD